MPLYERQPKTALLVEDLNWMVPKVALEAPAEITDREGNKSFISNKKKRCSVSIEGLITFSTNDVSAYSKKKMDFGGYNIYRIYDRELVYDREQFDRFGERLVYKIYANNEFGETINYETHGLHHRLLDVQDAFKRPLRIIEYDQKNGEYTFHSGKWEYDYVNNIYRRYEEMNGKAVGYDERRNSRDGYRIAHWKKGRYFGKDGLWRIEKGWDGEKVVDMFYTRYDEFANRTYETYHEDGYLVRETIKEGGTTYEKEVTKFSYRRLRYLDPRADGEIWFGDLVPRWEYVFDGLKIIKAQQYYHKMSFHDEIVFDLAENIDFARRVDNSTGEVLVVSEDRVYFSEVEELTVSELKDFLYTEDKIAESLYNWIQEMKMQGKAGASLFGIMDNKKEMVTLYDRDNLQYAELFLQPKVEEGDNWEY